MVIFPFVPAYATYEQTDKETSDLSLIAVVTTPTANFNSSGVISSLIYDDSESSSHFSPRPESILAGKWNLVVEEGNVTALEANFTMVSPEGTGRHDYTITNFRPSAAVPVILDIHGTRFVGIVSVIKDGEPIHYGAPVSVSIAKHDVLTLRLGSDFFDPFNGQPIYGVMYSLKDVSS